MSGEVGFESVGSSYHRSDISHRRSLILNSEFPRIALQVHLISAVDIPEARAGQVEGAVLVELSEIILSLRSDRETLERGQAGAEKHLGKTAISLYRIGDHARLGNDVACLLGGNLVKSV